MHLKWELVDLTQTPIELEGEPVTFNQRLPGGKVEVGRNAARRAELQLAIDDPESALVRPLETALRVTLVDGDDETLIFCGKVGTPETEAGAEGNTLTVPAVDPLGQLNTLLIRNSEITSEAGQEVEIWTPVSFGGGIGDTLDQSQAAWGLVNLVTGHGIREGTLPVAPGLYLGYQPGSSIGEALVQLCELWGSIDFELAPVLASDGTLCELNTFYPRQGSDKSATVNFVFGADPQTAVDFSHTENGEITNRLIVFPTGIGGSISFGRMDEHTESIEKYGPYEQLITPESFTAASLRGLLERVDAHFGASPTPIDFFTVTPAPEQADGWDDGPPKFGPDGDYWVGDTIACEAHLPGRDPLELKGQITDATLTENASGQLQTSIDCSPSSSSDGWESHSLRLWLPNEEGEAA